jgi:hypothetical protein
MFDNFSELIGFLEYILYFTWIILFYLKFPIFLLDIETLLIMCN